MTSRAGDLRCNWCGESFERASSKGPVPRYCRDSHRQRAYEARRELSRASQLVAQLDAGAVERAAQRAQLVVSTAAIARTMQRATAGIDTTAIGRVLEQAMAGIDSAAIGRAVEQATAGIDSAAIGRAVEQATAGIDTAAIGRALEQATAGIDTTAIARLENLSKRWADPGPEESVDGMAVASSELLSAAVALVIVAWLLAQLMPILLTLPVAAEDVAEVGVLSLEVTGHVVERIPGLQGALYLLAIHGIYEKTARRSKAKTTSGDRVDD